MYKQIQEYIKARGADYYTDSFDFDDPLSNNHSIFEFQMESMNEMLDYYKPNLLAAFGEDLKPESENKLNAWLADQDFMFLFEHELKISRAAQYYQSPQSFHVGIVEEWQEELPEDLRFDALTEEQRNELESECDCYIPEDSKRTFYFHQTGFEYTLPRKAILAAYADHVRSNR